MSVLDLGMIKEVIGNSIDFEDSHLSICTCHSQWNIFFTIYSLNIF